MAVEASVIIDFGDSDDDDVSGTIVVELDDTHSNNLDFEGNLKSSFAPDDKPVFVIHHDDTIEITGVSCTDGNVYDIGSDVILPREIDAVFTKVGTKVSLYYADVVDIDETWYGNIVSFYLDSLNNLDLVSDVDGVYPSYCKITFNVNFQQQWRLDPPPLVLDDDETYIIYVVVYARNVT